MRVCSTTTECSRCSRLLRSAFLSSRSSSSSSSSSSSLPADGPAVGVGGASVIPGADLAMAFMEDGKVVKWLGRVDVIYKEKAILCGSLKSTLKIAIARSSV